MQLIKKINAYDSSWIQKLSNEVHLEVNKLKDIKTYEELEDIEVPLDKIALEDYFTNRFKSEYNTKHLDGYFGSSDRITYSISEKFININDYSNCEYYQDIKDILLKNGYELIDYVKGICSKEDRKFKISKLLLKISKDNDISDTIKGFINSPYRSTSKKDLEITVSRNPYDVATMSTLKGWTSCMNLITGCMNYKIDYDLEFGTIIVYIHKKGEENLNNSVARFLIKPFHYKYNFYYYQSESKSYGTHNINIDLLGKELSNLINPTFDNPNELVIYKSECYMDSMNNEIPSINNEWDLNIPKHLELFSVNFIEDNNELSKLVNNIKDKAILFYKREDLLSYAKIDFDKKLMCDIKNTIGIDRFIIMSSLWYGNKFTKKDLITIKDFVDLSDNEVFKRIMRKYNGEQITFEDNIIPEKYMNIIELSNRNTNSPNLITEEELKVVKSIMTNKLIFKDDLKLSFFYSIIKTNSFGLTRNFGCLVSSINIPSLKNYLNEDEMVKLLRSINLIIINKNDMNLVLPYSYDKKIYEMIRNIPYGLRKLIYTVETKRDQR